MLSSIALISGENDAMYSPMFRGAAETVALAAEGSLLLAGALLNVAAELFAHCGQHFFREGVLLAGAEAGEEGGGEDVGGHSFLQCGLNGPTAFAGVLNVAGEFREARVFGERECAQIRSQELTTLPLRQSSAISPKSRL